MDESTTDERPPLDRRAKGWAIAGCILIGICLILLLVGCADKDNVDMDIDDDDVDAVVVPWTLYINYDDHPNVAARCDGTTRMYTTTRTDDPLQLIPDHPSCQGGDS